MMKHILILILLTIALCAAGCTGPAAPVPVTTPVPETPAAAVTPEATATIPPVTTKVAYAAPRPTWPVTVEQTTRIASDNPYLDYLNVRKRTFDYPIPNCVMQKAFPGILTENYGIRQIVPKLTALSEDDYLYFIRKNTEANKENTQLKTPAECYGAATDPTWNFIEVRVILKPTNFNAADYTITQNVISEGAIVASFPTTQRLVIDKDVTLISYIPIRENEVDLFDSVSVVYTRHP